MIAIVEASSQGLLRRDHWLRNVLAGVVVGIVALPLAMAFAIASGAKPEQGLYTAIVAGLAVSLLGGSRVQIAGPTGAFVVILAGITSKYGFDGLQIATLIAGFMLLTLGIARMGSIIKFIPDPVIAGFTTGIGVIIWVGQWKDFFGLHPEAGTHFHEKLLHALEALPGLHPATTMLAVLALAVNLLTPRIPGLRRIPGPLVALVVAGTIQAVFRFDGVVTIGSAFGGIPSGLPHFTLPEFSVSRVIELISPAFTIAMLGAIESLLSAVVADGMAGTRHDSNQELIGQGIANILAPLFGGFAATGAVARTATSIRNGGSSPLAGIIHVATLVLTILFLAPLAASVPLCALASILFIVAYNMSELRHFAWIVRKAPRADVAILLITFVLTVFVDLVVAVNVGVILATLQFMRRMASSVEVVQLSDADVRSELGRKAPVQIPAGVMVYSIEGPFFFGAVENFERALAQTHTDPRLLVLRLRRVPFMDSTALETIEEVVRNFARRHVRVALCEANPRVKGKLERAGILQLIGADGYADELASLIEGFRASAAAVPAKHSKSAA